jgi:hypothetical protein
MLETLLTVVIPGAVSWLVAMFRQHVTPLIPNHMMPFAMAFGGALITSLAAIFNIDIPNLDLISSDKIVAGFQGLVGGLSSVGLHQLYTKLTGPDES